MMETNSATATTPAPPCSILETCLHVEDLDRSREFYRELFGFSVMRTDERFCAFQVDERQVLILFRMGSDPDGTVLPFGIIPAHGSTGRAHVGFSTRDEALPAWRDRLNQFKVRIESEFKWPTGGTSVYFRDPDGHLLELLSPGVWPIY